MKKYFLIFPVLIIMLGLVVFSDKYIYAVKSGIELYVVSVLPALFPFFFLSKILTELNFGYDLGKVMEKPLRRFYGAPDICGYVMVMSMMCGYPVGAKLLSDLYQNNLLDKKEIKSALSFTSTSGPLFVVGTVGVFMLQNKKAGFILLLSHYLATLINGFIYRGKINKNDKQVPVPCIKYDKILSESMYSAIGSVLAVGGYIAIFNMLLEMSFDVGLIGCIARLLTNIGMNYRLSEGVFAGLIEITKGSLIISQSGFSFSTTIPLICFIITFGGFSVTLQSMTFLATCKVSPIYYIVTKFTQGILSFLLCKGLCFLLL